MSLFSRTAIFLYICTLTLYFSWGFTKLSNLFLIFVDLKLYWKQISVTLAYIISVFTIDRLVPDFLSKYTIVAFYLSFALIPWFGWKNILTRKHNMGELLFISESVSRTIYFMIPFTLLIFWAIYRNWLLISNNTMSSTINILGEEINCYLWSACLSIVLISIIVYGYIFSDRKLEIRERGIWFSVDEIVWEDIIDYSWLDNKSNLLKIKHINGFKNEIESKYKIKSHEKKLVENIFQDKLNNI